MSLGPKAIIHLDRLQQNIKLIREHIQQKPIMAVVKANAYGHGVIPVTRALKEAGVNRFAVFSFEEAIEIRDAGIQDSILVFCRLQPDFLKEAVDRNITLNLCWRDDIELLKQFYRKYKKSPEVHLKVDTGMSRLGVPYEESVSILKMLQESPEIKCTGLYSHYATADEGDLSYAEWQFRKFDKLAKQVKALNLPIRDIHFSNSGAILNLPQSYYNLVRVGILMYGVMPSNEVPLNIPVKPVMEYCGPIVNVHKVESGTNISYGGVYQTKKDSYIGVIQTGFADGFPRPWYVKGYVGYKGKKYKIAGRVCMDQFMVDFGDEKPDLGDMVLFFGENDENRIPAETISQETGMTTYMLLTAINGRTKREYRGL